jgi:hypothetical protein
MIHKQTIAFFTGFDKGTRLGVNAVHGNQLKISSSRRGLETRLNDKIIRCQKSDSELKGIVASPPISYLDRRIIFLWLRREEDAFHFANGEL